MYEDVYGDDCMDEMGCELVECGRFFDEMTTNRHPTTGTSGGASPKRKGQWPLPERGAGRRSK